MSDIIPRIIEKLRLLRVSQLLRVELLVDSLAAGCTFKVNISSDIATDEFCKEFGDTLRQHHNVSSEPFTKDKFEYAMVSVLNACRHAAMKAPMGNPGHDLTVDGVAWSLKTQADRNIKAGEIHISKYMELGKGRWVDEADVVILREGMFRHMRSYERIFTLRCLNRSHTQSGNTVYIYELVEIPKRLLLEARDQPITMYQDSRQVPKPASCYVYDADTKRLKFELYFDGGTERKLQVRKLDKRYCTVHATWTFTPV